MRELRNEMDSNWLNNGKIIKSPIVANLEWTRSLFIEMVISRLLTQQKTQNALAIWVVVVSRRAALEFWNL